MSHQCTTLTCRMGAATASLSDVDIDSTATREHPNALPFKGILLRTNLPSDQPPHGADGHRIFVPTEVARKRLGSLIGMALDWEPDLSGHDPRRKIGTITKAWIEGNAVWVAGLIWKKDFPEGVQRLRANKGKLGMSMELGDIYIRDKDEDVWHLQDFHFTGAAVLLRAKAAYWKTDLAAKGQQSFYVKTLAAAAAALANLERKGAKMADKEVKKDKDAATTQGQEFAQMMAAALEKSVNAGLVKLSDAITASNEKVLEAVGKLGEAFAKGQEDIAAGMTELAANMGTTSPTVASDPSDPTMAAARKGKGDPSATDPTQDGSDPTQDATDWEAEADPTITGDPSAPGNVNKDAEAHAKTQSDGGAEGQLKAAAEARKKKEREREQKVPVTSIAAAARKIRQQNETILSLEREKSKLENKVDRMSAQMERFAERVERKSATPELLALLERGGADVRELMAGGSKGGQVKMSVQEFDEMIVKSGFQLDVPTRMAMKNQMMANGWMDDGAVRRFTN